MFISNDINIDILKSQIGLLSQAHENLLTLVNFVGIRFLLNRLILKVLLQKKVFVSV